MKIRLERVVILAIIALTLSIFIKEMLKSEDKNKDYTSNNEVSVADGVNAIKKLEQKNVIEIEEKIDKLREKEAGEVDFKKLFSSSVIMGDSISEALVEYNILDKSSVVAYKGRNTSSAMQDVKTVVNLQPNKIFMTYGMNDVLLFNGNARNFVKQYEKLINEVKKGLPNSKIYISSVLPVQQKAINKKSAFKKIGDCNKAIQDMCEKLNITYIETSHLLDGRSDLYEGDGIHMKFNFYPLWLNEISQVAF